MGVEVVDMWENLGEFSLNFVVRIRDSDCGIQPGKVASYQHSVPVLCRDEWRGLATEKASEHETPSQQRNGTVRMDTFNEGTVSNSSVATKNVGKVREE